MFFFFFLDILLISEHIEMRLIAEYFFKPLSFYGA